jgi:hypothetical protein
MSIDELKIIYAFADGSVTSFTLDYEPRQFSIALNIKRQKGKDIFQSCAIELVFSGLSMLHIFEDFPTNGGYTDITFLKLDTGEFYLSLDPFGNSGFPHNEDNFIIISRTLRLINQEGEIHDVN